MPKKVNNKYENLLERTVRVMEQQVSVNNQLFEVADGIKQNVKILNDNFVLHKDKWDCMGKDVADIKATILKWLKYLAIALFITVGGLSVLKALAGAGIEKLLQ